MPRGEGHSDLDIGDLEHMNFEIRTLQHSELRLSDASIARTRPSSSSRRHQRHDCSLEAASVASKSSSPSATPAWRARTALRYRYFQMRHPPAGWRSPAPPQGQRNLRVLTQTEVTSVSGKRGDYNVTLKISLRYVNQNCTGCANARKWWLRRSPILTNAPVQNQGRLPAVRHGLSAALSRSPSSRLYNGKRGLCFIPIRRV